MLKRLGTWIEGRCRDNAVEVSAARSEHHPFVRHAFAAICRIIQNCTSLFSLPLPSWCMENRWRTPLPLPRASRQPDFARRFSTRT